jgi:hypothetical protein
VFNVDFRLAKVALVAVHGFCWIVACADNRLLFAATCLNLQRVGCYAVNAYTLARGGFAGFDVADLGHFARFDYNFHVMVGLVV